MQRIKGLISIIPVIKIFVVYQILNNFLDILTLYQICDDPFTLRKLNSHVTHNSSQ